MGRERERVVIGQVLGHCRVIAQIGEGGMGTVYRAHDEVLNRDVAVKVVNKGAGLDASASQNLLHEARASSALAHPGLESCRRHREVLRKYLHHLRSWRD